jgi:taurine dioxygenase
LDSIVQIPELTIEVASRPGAGDVLSSPERCAEVSGMTPELAAITVKYLFEHSTRDANVYRHAWSPGDVVMWDNRCVLHRADHDGVVGDRVLHRGMVAAQS